MDVNGTNVCSHWRLRSLLAYLLPLPASSLDPEHYILGLYSSLSKTMSSLFRIGQILKGRVGTYTVTKQIQETVWFAK